jgi:RNA recognition motif 2
LLAALHPLLSVLQVCSITYARIQGKNAMVAHFQNSSLLHEDKRCRPVLFRSEGFLAGAHRGALQRS